MDKIYWLQKLYNSNFKPEQKCFFVIYMAYLKAKILINLASKA